MSSHPAYDALVERLSDLAARRDALSAQIAIDTQQAIKLGLENFFRDYPELKQFCWTQRAGEYDDEGPLPGCSLIRLDAFGEVDDYDIYANLYQRQAPPQTSDWQALGAELQVFVNQWDETVLYQLFGEYHVVEATRTGVECHNYEDYHNL